MCKSNLCVSPVALQSLQNRKLDAAIFVCPHQSLTRFISSMSWPPTEDQAKLDVQILRGGMTYGNQAPSLMFKHQVSINPSLVPCPVSAHLSLFESCAHCGSRERAKRPVF